MAVLRMLPTFSTAKQPVFACSNTYKCPEFLCYGFYGPLKAHLWTLAGISEANLFSFFFFLMTILKVFIEFIAILFLFYDLVFWPWGIWDLGSQPGMESALPALEGAKSQPLDREWASELRFPGCFSVPPVHLNAWPAVGQGSRPDAAIINKWCTWSFDPQQLSA